MSSALASLASFVARTPIPDQAVVRAKQAIVDTVGVMLAGSAEPSARAVHQVAADEGCAPRCAVFGTQRRTSATLAALANGTAAHALDYDDMCFVSMAHPSAPLTAAAFAVGELAGSSGRALLEGYVAGFEVEGVLGRTMNPAHYEHGWHATSTIGTVGAAAAVARILDFDAEQTMRTLSIAASSASGLKENFGTMTKPLHAGLAARNAVQAALLASSGLTASERALDGPQGLFVAMRGSARDASVALQVLGRRWEILETGICVKLYPSCAATHPAIDALLELRRQHAFEAGDVERIDVTVDEVTPTVLIYDTPATGLEGKFSMQFCAAAAVAHGGVDLDTFDEGVTNPLTRELLPRVAVHVDRGLRKDRPALTEARVTVTLRDGSKLQREAHGARGYPEKPASDAEIEAKFRVCAARALDEERVNGALAALRELDGVRDVRQIVPLMMA